MKLALQSLGEGPLEPVTLFVIYQPRMDYQMPKFQLFKKNVFYVLGYENIYLLAHSYKFLTFLSYNINFQKNIWLMDWILKGTTTPSQNELVSNGNKGWRPSS